MDQLNPIMLGLPHVRRRPAALAVVPRAEGGLR